jgi:hypothetical protein
MPAQAADANTSQDGIPTSAYYEDRGDGTSSWLHKVRIHNGGDTTQGAIADAAVTNPASSGSVIALLKGILTFLRVAAGGLGKNEDAAHASGDTGVMALGVRRDTAAASSGTNGDYEPFQTDALGRLRVTGPYLEDVAAVTGDAGFPAFAVRRDAAAAGAGTDGDYEVLSTDSVAQLRTAAERAGTATITNVADNAASTQLLAANTARRGVTIVNTSSAILHIAYGATAVIATARTATIAASGGEWTMPGPIYTGVINGIWATDPGDGVAIITQLT